MEERSYRRERNSNTRLAFSSIAYDRFLCSKGACRVPERTWTPVEVPLDVELIKLSDSGAIPIIFPNGTKHVPILQGRLNPILDAHERTYTYLYADNIAINGGLQQPVHFALGEELDLIDAEGQDAMVRIVAIVGRAALIQYYRV